MGKNLTNTDIVHYMLAAVVFLNNARYCTLQPPAYSHGELRLKSGERVNITALVDQFILTCGSSYNLCHPEKATYNITYTKESECLLFSKCTSDCAMSDTCSPDANAAFLSMSCVPKVLYPLSAIGKEGYKMVVKYPASFSAATDLEKNCNDLERITEANFLLEKFRPVVSQRSGLTYRNKFCAYAYDDMSTLPFDIQILCQKFLDINSFSTYTALLKSLKLNECHLSYVPPERSSSQVYHCSTSSSVISRCNETGLWVDYDPQIEWACENFNSFTFKGFRNVFCYICNPGLISSLERVLIDTCNVTGVWFQTNPELEKYCLQYPTTSRTFPFKNIFCKHCNGYSTQQRRYKEFSLNSFREYRESDGTFSAIFHNIIFTNEAHDARINTSCGLSGTWVISGEAVDHHCGFEKVCTDITLPYNSYKRYFFPVCSAQSDCTSPDDLSDSSLSARKNEIENNLNKPDVLNRSQEVNLFSKLSVISETTNIFYRNLYCARQNGDIGAVTSPRLKLTCSNFIDMSLVVEFKDILQIVTKNHCQIQTGFTNQTTSYCSQGSICVTSCKYGPDRSTYKKETVDSCESSNLIQPVIYNGVIFKNLFCIMCNNDTIHNIGKNGSDIIEECSEIEAFAPNDEVIRDKCMNENISVDYYPFKNMFCAICNTAMARPVREEWRTISTFFQPKPIRTDYVPCSGFACFLVNAPYRILFSLTDLKLNSEGPSPNFGRSQTTLCPPGRILQDGRCHVLLDHTSDLGYSLSLRAQIMSINDTTHSPTVSSTSFALIITGIPTLMYSANLHKGIEYIQINVSCFQECNEKVIPSTAPASSAHVGYDMDNINYTTDFTFSNEINKTEFEVNILLFIKETKNRTHIEESLQNLGDSLINITHLGVLMSVKFLATRPECKLTVPKENKNTCVVPSLSFNNSEIAKTGIKFIHVNELLMCVLTELNNYTEDLINFLCDNKIVFDVSRDKKSIRFCAKHLEKLVGRDNWNTSIFRFVYGIFNIICTLVSVICLFVTFVTYSKFKSLRNIPGVNNMNLVFSLFWAQLFLQFGLWQIHNRGMCIFLGIATHYFWLASFCAMNVCSYHMFEVFASPMMISKEFSQRKTFIYSFFVYGTPFIFISIFNVVIVTTNNFDTFGYGNGICFMSNFISISIMFITPASVIIAINAVFFGIASWHIRSSPNVQSNISIDYFKIYIKLFTITGLAWVLLFIDTLLPLSLFSFAATLAGALQGVYIFIAFICTSKIWTLYKSVFQNIHCCNLIRKQDSGYDKSTTLSSDWVQNHLENSKETFV